MNGQGILEKFLVPYSACSFRTANSKCLPTIEFDKHFMGFMSGKNVFSIVKVFLKPFENAFLICHSTVSFRRLLLIIFFNAKCCD